MSKSRLEWKVGLFVFIGLVLLAALLIQFSKGMSLFRPTYEIDLAAPTVGGLKERAAVLMSGVQVGTVSAIHLAGDGKSVTLVLRIYLSYRIYKDARFAIEQSGFLGDNYVAIIPTNNQGDTFKNGDIAHAEAPFDLQEFTRSASGFIVRIDETVKNLNAALADVTRTLLNPETLTNLAMTAGNLRQFSEQALMTVDNINLLVNSNAASISGSVSNLSLFSGEMNQLAGDLRGLVASNSDSIARAVSNVEASSESLKSLMENIDAGKGLAGNLIKNPELAAGMSQIVTNLSITTSNLNRLGLWRILWQHKPPKTGGIPGRPLTMPKNVFDESVVGARAAQSPQPP